MIEPVWQAFGGEGNWSFRCERNARTGARVSLAPKTPFSFPFQTPAMKARDDPICSLIYCTLLNSTQLNQTPHYLKCYFGCPFHTMFPVN